ncbi:hypothetical protein [Phormidium nigroviride]
MSQDLRTEPKKPGFDFRSTSSFLTKILRPDPQILSKTVRLTLTAQARFLGL